MSFNPDTDPVPELQRPQPSPKDGEGPSVWSLVMQDMVDRRLVGVRKYGKEIQARNGRDALVDAYQEALDLCVYLRQVIEERAIDKREADKRQAEAEEAKLAELERQRMENEGGKKPPDPYGEGYQ